MKIEKNAEIIAVGSELLLGQIANTNAQFISKQLAEIGVNMFYHTVVGDNVSRLKQVIKTAQERSDFLIFTGGLGPTKDDLTKETIAEIIGRPLVINDEAMASIERYFAKTNRMMSPNNRKQALVLEGSDVLVNRFGMAPGMLLESNGCFYMLLPGPPSEMKPMVEQEAIPLLLEKFGHNEKIVSKVLRFFGIGESQLETDLEDIIDSQTNPTIAPLAADGEVTLRLTAKHADQDETKRLLEEAEAKIMERVGEYFYGYDDTSLVGELVKACREKGLSLSAAESFTGGLFSEGITNISGVSSFFKGSVVCYTNEMKTSVVGVSEQTLRHHGAVSAECAKELAAGIKSVSGSDIGISFTGVAGPDSQEGHPPGKVFIGIAITGKPVLSFEFIFAGTRTGIRKRSAKYGSYLLLKELEN
ncbi:competence/damage-inducible protein A [Bacillus gobiensis]|uniref:competence/damage-inducible protein A n=1 Tax=Bacillus gobiensis TaxID=1441095 RepID=UPI003D208B18